MALLDFILNLVGLLLWFNWRAARFDPIAHSRPATLAGTIRRAEKSPLKRWHLPLALLALLLLRAPLYSLFGSALNWTGVIDVGTIAVPFRAAENQVTMLLFSGYSFAVVLATFLIWVLFLSALKSGTPESDSLRQLLRLHLGKIESWPAVVKLVLPFPVVSLLWWAACWPLNHYQIVPAPATFNARHLQALLVGLGSYLALKPLLLGILALYFISSYVYFGRQPFWQHLEIVGRQLLQPLRRLPLRFGRMDWSPVVGILIVWLLAHAAENGIKTPLRRSPDGAPQGRLVNVPGLVDWYARVAK